VLKQQGEFFTSSVGVFTGLLRRPSMFPLALPQSGPQRRLSNRLSIDTGEEVTRCSSSTAQVKALLRLRAQVGFPVWRKAPTWCRWLLIDNLTTDRDSDQPVRTNLAKFRRVGHLRAQRTYGHTRALFASAEPRAGV
jgi:hypothetical protein